MGPGQARISVSLEILHNNNNNNARPDQIDGGFAFLPSSPRVLGTPDTGCPHVPVPPGTLVLSSRPSATCGVQAVAPSPPSTPGIFSRATDRELLGDGAGTCIPTVTALGQAWTATDAFGGKQQKTRVEVANLGGHGSPP